MEHVNGGATGQQQQQHAGLEAIVKANNNTSQPTVQHAQLKPEDFKVVRTLGTGKCSPFRLASSFILFSTKGTYPLYIQ